LRQAQFATLGLLALGLGLGACDAVVGAGNRKLNTSVVCNDDGCVCAAGFGDCDGEPDNGCERDLDDPKNCGACGNVCDNGECVDLACACAEGFGECDGDPATVCETNLAGDSAHCGTCERDCAGSGCDAGLCVSVTVGPPGNVYTYYFEDGTVYFAPQVSPGVWQVPAEGGLAQQIGTDMVLANLLVHDAGTVYWTSEDSVLATSVATGETQTLAPQQYPVTRVAVAGGKVYWGNLDQTTNLFSIRRTSTTPGGMVENVAELGTAGFIYDFAVTPDGVFWSQVDTVVYTAHDSVAPITPIVFQVAPRAPVYFEPTATSLLFTGNPDGTYELPLQSGSAKELATLSGYGRLTADDANVYFVTAIGSSDPAELWRAARSGTGPPAKLVESADLLPFLPLAVDAKWVYWLDVGQASLVRVAK